jgi:transposase
MISNDLEAKILRLYGTEKWRTGTIARQLGVHHAVVERVVSKAETKNDRRLNRASMVDPYVPFIIETLEKYPTLPASRLHSMVQERGYPGGADHFRSIVRRYRPRKQAEAYLRLRTLPGEEAQVDWAHFGSHEIGRGKRTLSAFVMVLSWSRMLYVRFFWDQRMAAFLAGHVGAFEAFGGVPRRLLYDNLKSAVLERRRDAIRFHPKLLEFSAHYCYEPRPVAVARGNEKGRVERAILYLRTSFFPARQWCSLADLNAQVQAWSGGPASIRQCPEDRGMTVREAGESERPKLLALPDNPFPAEERAEARVGRTPYIRFDRNDYSVPFKHTRRTVVVLATTSDLRILADGETIAAHKRSYDSGALIEDPAHIKELVANKRAAREGRGIDRLYHVAPKSQEFFNALAERGANLGAATNSLNRLLDDYGAAELEAALCEVLERQTPHLAAVRQVLDQSRRRRHLPPPVSVDLPDDSRLEDLAVRTHRLDSYDPTPEPRDDEDTK